jgi:hypothetical protein
VPPQQVPPGSSTITPRSAVNAFESFHSAHPEGFPSAKGLHKYGEVKNDKSICSVAALMNHVLCNTLVRYLQACRHISPILTVPNRVPQQG